MGDIVALLQISIFLICGIMGILVALYCILSAKKYNTDDNKKPYDDYINSNDSNLENTNLEEDEDDPIQRF